MTPPSDDSYSSAAFFARTGAARLAEAERLWPALQAAGATEQTVLLVDFVVYGRDAGAAEAIAAELAPTYQAEVRPFEAGGWMLVGTTRPRGTRFTQDKLRGWVAYVNDLAARHGFVFSAWSVEAPALGVVLASEQFEAPPEG